MSLDALQPSLANPKQHSSEDIDQSISRFGYVELIVVDERTGRMVVGHGRREALLKMREDCKPPPAGVVLRDGTWYVPVQRGWASKTDREAEAYLLASNRLSEKGGWDVTAQARMMQGWNEADLVGIGFGVDDLQRFAAMETGSFLDGFGAPNGTDTEVTSTPTEDGYITFSLKLLPEQDAKVQQAIRAAKKRFAVRTNLEAILSMCEKILEGSI